MLSSSLFQLLSAALACRVNYNLNRVQTMSILIVNQSVIDMCASIFTIVTHSISFVMTGLSRDSIYDQFVCRFWLSKRPLWCVLVTSTYGILITALSRYIAVIYPIKYKVVRIHYCVLLCTGCSNG